MYKIHKLQADGLGNDDKQKDSLETFLNSLKGEVVSVVIIPSHHFPGLIAYAYIVERE